MVNSKQLTGTFSARLLLGAAGTALVFTAFLSFSSLHHLGQSPRGALCDASPATTVKSGAVTATNAGLEAVSPLLPTKTGSAPESSGDVLLEIAPQVMKEVQRRVAAKLKHVQYELYWQIEDQALRRIPKFDDVREVARKTASEAVAAESIGWQQTDKILELAQARLDAFWDAGSLASPEAYEHGYVARAILEIALEHNPENFRLLDLLRESINSTMPVRFADYKRNHDAIEALWTIVEQQRALIDSGKVPPSPMAFDAIYDWIQLVVLRSGSPQDSVPGWKWLLENAEAGGWGSISDVCRRGLEAARQGRKYSAMIYIYPQTDAQPDEVIRVKAMHGRRLASLKGSRHRRAVLTPIWAPDARPTMSWSAR